MKKKKIIVVMPAYKAAKTIAATYKDIPPGVVDEVIVVDDNSPDDTIAIAKKLGLTIITHKKKSWLWRKSKNMLQRST